MFLYRWLLKLYPTAFRRRFGQDMLEVFSDRWRLARRAGPWQTARLIVASTTDAIVHAVAEHRLQRHSHASTSRLSGGTPVSFLAHDVRYAIRMFRARPALTAAALVTMALGIAANTAVFAVIRPLLLTPPPFPEPDRVVLVYEGVKAKPSDRYVANPSNFDAWERTPGVFSALAGHSGWQATLTGAGDPVRLRMTTAMPAIFEVFGVRPVRGRSFTEAEAAARARVIVISHALWRDRFGADPGVIGRLITIDGNPWEVIGLMPKEFDAPFQAQAWVPLTVTQADRQNRNSWFLQTVGRRAPGQTTEAATRALTTAMEALASPTSRFNRDRVARVVTWQDGEVSYVRSGLWMLQTMALIVLVIAGANLANLLLAQATGRTREFALRSAIGASRAQIVRQLVTEALVLAAVGGALGILIAVWTVPAIAGLAPDWLPRASELQVAWTDVAVSLGLAIVAGLFFSVLPAVLCVRRATRPVPVAASYTATGTRAERLMRSGLITCQVALALMLLGGAAVLVKSFVKLTSQPIGFSPDHILTAEVALPRKSYPDAEPRRALFTSLVRDVGTQPGVRSVAATTALPFTWWEFMTDFSVLGDGPAKSVDTAFRVVSPSYFDTLQVPLLQGRLLADTDTSAAPYVAVVNDAFARKHAAFGRIIGARLRDNDEPNSPPITIVGIVGDTRHRSFERPAQAELYLPLGQHAPVFMTLAVRTLGRPLDLAPQVRSSLRALDPTLPLNEVKTLDFWVGAAVAEERFYLTLLGVLASLAVLLAVVGNYGVTAYVMRLRTREIGIRLALGATVPRVAGLVVRQGLLPVVAGVVIGLGAVLVGARILEDQLFQTGARDPIAILAATAILFGTAAIACWLPARRASRVNPAIVLRQD